MTQEVNNDSKDFIFIVCFVLSLFCGPHCKDFIFMRRVHEVILCLCHVGLSQRPLGRQRHLCQQLYLDLVRLGQDLLVLQRLVLQQLVHHLLWQLLCQPLELLQRRVHHLLRLDLHLLVLQQLVLQVCQVAQGPRGPSDRFALGLCRRIEVES